MRHHTTVRAIISWVGIRVVCVDIENNPIWTLVATTKDFISMQDREFFQRLAIALVRELQLPVVAKGLRVATWNREERG